jgi:hypothetical protein
MPCILNINDLNNLNRCAMNIAGISKIYITNYNPDFFNSLEFFGNYVNKINQTIRFLELDYNRINSKYSDLYNYESNKYELSLDLELVGLDYEKRTVMDALVKSKIMVIFKSMNGKYFLLGEKVGITSSKFSSTTDVYSGKSVYNFTFNSKSDYLPFGVAEDLIDSITKIDCSDINSSLALGNLYLWLPYSECIVGNFDGFVEP